MNGIGLSVHQHLCQLHNISILTRPENAADIGAIRLVNATAFPTDSEAGLVDVLREKASPLVSLVATSEKDAVVGHIMFSPVKLDTDVRLNIMGLAPMAVLPGCQRLGIGSLLVRAGLDACRQIGVGAVAVLGHPEYYPKFGFRPSTEYDIISEYDVPKEVFMMIELEANYLDGASGTIQFHPAFKDLE